MPVSAKRLYNFLESKNDVRPRRRTKFLHLDILRIKVTYKDENSDIPQFYRPCNPWLFLVETCRIFSNEDKFFSAKRNKLTLS